MRKKEFFGKTSIIHVERLFEFTSKLALRRFADVHQYPGSLLERGGTLGGGASLAAVTTPIVRSETTLALNNFASNACNTLEEYLSIQVIN